MLRNCLVTTLAAALTLPTVALAWDGHGGGWESGGHHGGWAAAVGGHSGSWGGGWGRGGGWGGGGWGRRGWGGYGGTAAMAVTAAATGLLALVWTVGLGLLRICKCRSGLCPKRRRPYRSVNRFGLAVFARRPQCCNAINF
jgi:hypothetical protein